MGNKPYVAIGPVDSDGELMDISDVFGEIRMERHIPFDELRDASIEAGDKPAISLTGKLVAGHPRIRRPLERVSGKREWVAEVLLDLNLKEWSKIAGHLSEETCTLNGKASFDRVWKDIKIVGKVTDEQESQERVPVTGEEFGTSWSARILGIASLNSDD